MNEKRLHELAAQFRCPSGEQGVKTGEKMFKTNCHITDLSIEAIEPKDNDIILEIGMGVARQTKSLLDAAQNITYLGVEMSSLMLEEAQRINREYIISGQANFQLSDGKTLPLPDQSCHKVFTVNTLYFWKDPVSYLHEIYRVLTDKGVFCLTFASCEFMSKLPFSRYGFTLYAIEEVQALFNKTAFHIQDIQSVIEPDVYHVNGFADREVFFLLATK